MNRNSRTTKTPRFLIALGITMIFPFSVAAQPSSGDGSKPSLVPNELIILLDHGPIVPTPEAVVGSVNSKRPVPGGLAIGNPVASWFMVADRASEAARAIFEESPDIPEAILQRYVVMTYPAVVDLDKIQAALEMNPNVLWVGKNSYAELAATEPTDPFFDDNPGGVPRLPEQHQWGSYSLHLPEAWDYYKGHSYVAIVDTGTDTDHPDLRPFDAAGNFIGGNFRAHLSRDYGYDDDNVDEGQTQGTATVSRAGHGTHVSGIVDATPNNSIGVAGACWYCSLLVSKVSRIRSSDHANVSITTSDLVDGINGAIGRGAQVLNLSLGYRPGSHPDCATTPLDPLCVALELLENRDTVMTAAAGNDGGQASDFPAIDSRVIGVGGIEPDGSFWNDCPGEECGSNVNPSQIVAPAKQIYSTFYEGLPYFPEIWCSDSVGGTVDGFGLCSGTSMSSPYAAGAVGILRSINPLLTKANIQSLLTSNVENPPGWDPANGIGKPNTRAAVEDALGNVNNVVLTNRLTPLFQLYSSISEDHVYTTFPQMATGFQWSTSDYYSPSFGAPQVGGYGPYFPGGKTCSFGPCNRYARASVYLFSTDRSPSATVPLVPLYRMSFEGTFPGGPDNPNNRDHTYTTEAAGINHFASIGYRLDGIEGYIYKRCSPEPSCIPAGSVRLYRYYNATRDDWAIFPESDLADWQADGYAAQPGYNAWIGYVYPNVDSDSDNVIDGFEAALLGTKPQSADSDCDGISDGTEVLGYPHSDPGGADHLNLTNQTIATTHPFSACRTITAGNNFVIAPSGDVTLHAVDWVALGPGFKISSGGQLKVVVP